MSDQVSATVALAYLDSRLRQRRQDCYERLKAAERFHQQLLALHLQGQINALDRTRQYVAHLLDWCESDAKRFTKANGG
jgi:hypothetical protein